jgi:hypothetical protein
MNLYDLMLGAQGGQGVNTLANQFGLSQQQTQAALQAMMPAFATGFQKAMEDPMGLGALMSQMANAAHAQTYANPAQAAAAPGLGGNVVGQIFGTQQIQNQVSQQAAQASGVSSQIIQQMLPIVASMIIGGVSNAMAAQGMSGLIAQTASQFAANAGLAPSVAAAAQNPALHATNMMSAWMTLMGSMMSGAAGATTPQATAMQAGINALNSMMQAGVQVSQAQQQGLNVLLNSMGQTAKS